MDKEGILTKFGSSPNPDNKTVQCFLKLLAFILQGAALQRSPLYYIKG